MDRLEGDIFLDMGPTVAKLLEEGIRFIVYAGDQDFICNWMGNKVWRTYTIVILIYGTRAFIGGQLTYLCIFLLTKHFLCSISRAVVDTMEEDLTHTFALWQAWIDSMEWAKADKWTGGLNKWEIDNKNGETTAAGECSAVEPLTFCKIYQAGHMVPMDQPESALAMVHTFIAKDSFVSPAQTPKKIIQKISKVV